MRKQGNADIFFCLLTKILVFLLVSLFRFIENQFEKLAMLNSEFCKTILPELYVDESKSLVRKIPCDKGDLDQNGCAQLATIKINVKIEDLKVILVNFFNFINISSLSKQC